MKAQSIVARFKQYVQDPPFGTAAIFYEKLYHIPGWSTFSHALFFRAVLTEARKAPLRVLVCGVYHGLDLALLEALAKRLELQVELTGVDLFSPAPCADWAPGTQGMTWQQAHHCEPPSMLTAQKNCPSARIIQENSISYLAAHADEFDFIYLDTSHDYETCKAEITMAKSGVHHPCIIGGDDYRGPAHWGVDRACRELLPNHVALFDRIWVSDLP